MSKWFLDERREALEEVFFMKREREILEKIKNKQEKTKAREVLSMVSGIKDPTLLASAVELGIKAETFAALSLVPLIEVAWADQILESNEKEAILEWARTVGLEKGAEGYSLLESWLGQKPSPILFQTWAEYTRELSKVLGEEEWQKLKDEVLVRSRRVAEVSGGILGVGSLSKSEEKVLQNLEKVFTKA